jgi:hypothetical protein
MIAQRKYTPQELANLTIKRNGNFECKRCGRAFESQAALALHVNTRVYRTSYSRKFGVR